jgi:hypothetical protein
MTETNGFQMAGPTRAEFNDLTSLEDFRELTKQPRLKVLQSSQPVADSVWSLLNEHFASVRPDVEIRVYGHYSTVCDLHFARLLTNVRRFAADCLTNAIHVEEIAAIPQLESLSVGIFELKDLRFLEDVSPNLTTLGLGVTRSKKPSLGPLSRFRSLKELYLEGHSKEIDVISDLPELEDITLRSITTPDLEFLSNLRKLWSLDIKLGGIRDFRGILGKESIKYLELWQVRELLEIDVVSTLPGLQNLFLQSLPKITKFPQLVKSDRLRRIVVENLKGLTDFTPLQSAPALEEFALLDGKQQTPTQLLPVLNNPSLRRICAYFGSDRKNNEFRQLSDAHAKSAWSLSEPFSYR